MHIFSSTKDNFSTEKLWASCMDYNETVTLIKTDLNTIIGVYNPDRWEDTWGEESSAGGDDTKHI